MIWIGYHYDWGANVEDAVLIKMVDGHPTPTILYDPYNRNIPLIVPGVEYEATVVATGNRIQFALRRTDGQDVINGWGIDYTDTSSPLLQGGCGFGTYNDGNDFSFFKMESVGDPPTTTVIVR